MNEPRRWPDDSPAEDAEAERAAELDRLDQWAREQKTRPLADALTEHGIMPGDPGGESWSGPLVLPDWWDDIPEPLDQCPWCQRRGVPSPCPECRAARAADADQPAEWAWWPRCTPAQRRLHIAATYGTDPWSGRHCRIYTEWTDVDAAGQISTTYPLWFGAAPAGIYWGARRSAPN